MNDDHATVLLVDDEQGLLELYEVWLSDTCEVRTAGCGEAALDRMDGEVDVVFLDRRMPDLSGMEVLRELRDRGYDCPVAMLTAVHPEDDAGDGPFDEYLTKPVDEEDIKRTLDALR
jgi:CheY-like chemotaxis protein